MTHETTTASARAELTDEELEAQQGKELPVAMSVVMPDVVVDDFDAPDRPFP